MQMKIYTELLPLAWPEKKIKRPQAHKLMFFFLWEGGPKGHKQIQPGREKIVLEITMGYCKINLWKR